jgi:uncharacterized membrane protein
VNTTNRSATEYLKRIEELLADIGGDDRASLLADLTEQLSDIPGSEVLARLGTPEEFVEEYRRSAGIETPSEAARPERAIRLDTLISAICLPFGIAILLSFGGQLLFGPFVLAIEWILARISPRTLRLFWSALAGLLAGEIVYLVVGLNGSQGRTLTGLLVALATAAVTGLLFIRTTDGRHPTKSEAVRERHLPLG